MGSSAVAPMHWLAQSSADSMYFAHSAVLPMHPTGHPSAGWPMDQAERSSAEKPMH